MNIPFPIIYPPLVDPEWFCADNLYDEEIELNRMEQANQRWLDSIGKKYMKPVAQLKPRPVPMEEAETDDDVFIVTANDEISEESPDIDEEEEMPTTTESPPENNDESESPEEPTESAELEVDATVWPDVSQNE